MRTHDAILRFALTGVVCLLMLAIMRSVVRGNAMQSLYDRLISACLWLGIAAIAVRVVLDVWAWRKRR